MGCINIIDELIIKLNKVEIEEIIDEDLKEFGDFLYSWVTDNYFAEKFGQYLDKYTCLFKGKFYRGDLELLDNLYVGKVLNNTYWSFSENYEIADGFRNDKRMYIDDYEEGTVSVIYILEDLYGFPVTSVITESMIFAEYIMEREYKVNTPLEVTSVVKKYHESEYVYYEVHLKQILKDNLQLSKPPTEKVWSYVNRKCKPFGKSNGTIEEINIKCCHCGNQIGYTTPTDNKDICFFSV